MRSFLRSIHRPCTALACAGIVLVAPTLAQERTAVLRDEARFREAAVGGAASDDPSLPRPLAPRGRAGRLGDELSAEPAGDPDFLGFAAGPYFPPRAERLDPLLLQNLARVASDGRPTAETFGFAMLARRWTPQLEEELRSLGVRVLGFHPFHCLRVAVSATSLPALAAHPGVRWVGTARRWQKLHPALALRLQRSASSDVLDLVVDLFASDLGAASTRQPYPGLALEVRGLDAATHDLGASGRPLVEVWRSNGWQQRALEAEGLVVERYLPEIEAFRLRATSAQIERLLELDFVQLVELDAPGEASHGESMAMISADSGRAHYDGGVNQVAVVGVIDSGYESSHVALDHLQVLGVDLTGTGSLQDDPCGHGSHVLGTIAGSDSGTRSGSSGAAPGLASAWSQALRSVRVFPGSVYGICGTAQGTLADRFSPMRNPVAGAGFTFGKPHLVHNSWRSSTQGTPWFGTEADARTLDAEVWTYEQLYVFAAGNEGAGGSGTIGLPSVAKNAFAVGAVTTERSAANELPGVIDPTSSRGPCGDGRWKPNVVAPGTAIESVDSRTSSGYVVKSGTSMAAAHVSGVAAQLLDHYASLRFAPHRMASLLMATALAKDGAAHLTALDAHLRSYGTGRIDAHRAHALGGDTQWTNWAMNVTNTWHYADFVVDPGTTRLVVCLAYHEAQASAGASQALVKDLDLWLDRDPIDTANGNTGEYSIHQSRIDNVEIRTIDNPPVGAWRWKVYPAVTAGTARASVTVLRETGALQPQLALRLSAMRSYLRPGETNALSAELESSAYVGSAVFVETDRATLGAARVDESIAFLVDRTSADLRSNAQGGLDVLLGNATADFERQWELGLSFASEGAKVVRMRGLSENGQTAQATTSFVVDGTPPNLPPLLRSSSHQPGVWSNRAQLRLDWDPATDALSPIRCYFVSVDHDSTTPPSSTLSALYFGQEAELALSSSAQTYFAKLAAQDVAGNLTSSFVLAGPFQIDLDPPSAAQNFRSTSHGVGTWSNQGTLDLAWIRSIDAPSGLAGYALRIDNAATAEPSGALDLSTSALVASVPVAGSHASWFVHLRPQDVAGNWGPTVHLGPLSIDLQPPQTPRLAIDRGSPSTTSASVQLEIASADAHSGLAEMRFRNDGGSFSNWEPFAPRKDWDLGTGTSNTSRGTRTVFVEVRDRAGNVAAGSASIYYAYFPLYFGSGCAGALGVPSFEVSGILGIGHTTTFTVSNTSASTEFLYAGVSRANWLGIPLPLDLGLIGSAGCMLEISLDAPLYQGLPGALSVAVPAEPSLANAPFFVQALLLGDPSGVPVITTRGAMLALGGL